MMTASEALEQTWKQVAAACPKADGFYHRRLPLPCQWPAHAGIRHPGGARVLIFESELQAIRNLNLCDETKGYAVEISPDEANRQDRVCIRIMETGQGFHEIFAIFCADLLDHWAPHPDPKNALKSLHGRLGHWKRFFQRGPHTGLTRDEYIGLFGELSFLDRVLLAAISPEVAVSAWQAPLGTNQDFLFGPRAVEVKTTTGNDLDRVKISNIRQLDPTGLENLFLARFAFDFREGAGITLSQLADHIYHKFRQLSPETTAIYADRLLNAGYHPSVSGEFDNYGFTLRKYDFFSVDERFPSLLESEMPSGVSDVSYTLNLASATAFLTQEAVLWHTLTNPNA
jgi:hypothetical protein